MKSAVAVGALLFAVAAHAAPVDPRFAAAEGLAKKRETDAAADLYRALLKEGVDGAGLRYNLGTLCLEDGHIGEAVLELRAARRLAPGDDDVKHNLEVALEARVDRLAGEAPADPVKSIGARLSPLTARLLFAIPLLLLGILVTALAFIDGKRGLFRALFVIVGVAAVGGGGLYACRKSVEATREAVVLVDAAPALKEADDAAAVSFTAHAGLFGDVVDESGPFLRVRFENGLEAWIKADAAGLIE